jgi:hypothetical protein
MAIALAQVQKWRLEDGFHCVDKIESVESGAAPPYHGPQ